MKHRMALVPVMVLVTLGVPAASAQGNGDDTGEGGGALVDVIHDDDVIIEGSLCASAGNRCEDGESFFGDPAGVVTTAKLKDNIPELWFEDFNTDGGDWAIASGEGTLRFIDDIGESVLELRQAQASPVREVLRYKASVPPQTVFENTGTGAAWSFSMAANDQFIVSRRGTSAVEARFYPNGDLRMRGAVRAKNFIQTSDADLKTGFVPVDSAAVLDAVAALPVAEWSFRDDPDGVRHVGPTAQDFAAAFGLGDTRTGIASVDSDGIALAAIQALAAENAAQDQLIDELLQRIEALEAAS